MNLSGNKDPFQLESIAQYLHDKQDVILEEWRNSMKKKEGEQVTTLATLSRSKFYDSIPEFLEQLCKNFRGEESSLSEVAKKHGAHRWEHGLDLREVTSEWRILNLILFDQIYQSRESISISWESLAEAQKFTTRFVHDGIKASIDEYYRLLSLEAEGKVRVLEQAIQKMEKLTEQRSQNLQETSHDMRGSMTALRIHLDLLEKDDFSDQARIGQLVEKLSGATDSLNQLLKNLLDLSRLEAGREELEISEFDAAELLRSLSDTMRPLADAENLDFRTQGDDKLIVRGDRLKIHRIAQNLLLNALKYTQQGYVQITWGVASSERWQFGIRDTGPGMDLTQLPFRSKATPQSESTREPSTETDGEDLTQAATKSKSEGIGLFIVRRLCELLEGIIDIDSEKDVGTMVRVTFPKDYPPNG